MLLSGNLNDLTSFNLVQTQYITVVRPGARW